MTFLLNLLVYVAFFALLVHLGNKAVPILQRVVSTVKIIGVTLVVRLFLGYLIGIPFFGIANLLRALNGHAVSGGQLAQSLAFELAWFIAVGCLTIPVMKSLKWVGWAAGLFILACVLRVNLPSTSQLLESKIKGLDARVVATLTPDQLMVLLCGDIKQTASGRFQTQGLLLISDYQTEAGKLQSNEEFVSRTKQFRRDMVKLLYLEEEANGSLVVYPKQYLRFRVWPKIAKLAGVFERLLFALVVSLIFGFLVFPHLNKELGEHTKFVSIITFFILIIGSVLLSGTAVGDVLNNIPKFLFGDFSQLLSTRQGMYIFLGGLLGLVFLAAIVYACFKGKTNTIVTLLAVLAVAGILWYNYGPKPAPPPPPPLLKNPCQIYIKGGEPLKAGEVYWVTNVKGTVCSGSLDDVHKPAFKFEEGFRYKNEIATDLNLGMSVLIEKGDAQKVVFKWRKEGW
ncbi:MAG: hypothetical protein V1688_03880 [bacterium]